MILKSHLSALCSFSWLLGSSTSRSDLILILHVKSLLSVCWSILNSSLYLKTSQGDEGWYCLSPFLNFWVFKRPKRIHTPHSLFWDFWADKTFTTSWSGSRVQVQAPAYRLTITPKGFSRWQSKVLTAKSMAELFWQALRHSLGRSWGPRVRSNTGSFWVSCSCCWQWQAHLRKKCCHSCDTDSVQESKTF